jgi:protocatechuate 3,4-dioxygenase beta subunit
MLPFTILLCAFTQLFTVDARSVQSEALHARSIAGRIDSEHAGSRAPVRRARVSLTRDGEKRPSAITNTGGEGQYRFDGLTPGRYIVTAEKPGFVTLASAPIDVTSTSSSFDLRLTPGGAVEGRLQDVRSAPIARAAVTADRLSEAGTVLGSYSAVTDDLGRFRIHSLAAGRYRVRTTPPPPASGQELFYPGTTAASDAGLIPITPGLTSERLDFRVPLGRLSPIAAAVLATAPDAPDPKVTRIVGTIMRSDSGQGIGDATVQLADERGLVKYRAISEFDGQFALSTVPAGTWTLSAVATGFTSVDATVTRPAGAGIRITIKGGERIQQDVRLVPITAIEGRVLDEFGDPAPGVVVQVAQKGGSVGVSRFFTRPAITTTGTTDDRGWFRAPGLVPGDYYLLAVPQPFGESWMTGFSLTFSPGTPSARSAVPISIVAGRDVYDADFTIVGGHTGTVTGQIVDASGQVVPKSQVMLFPVEDGEVRTMVMAKGTADASGRFSFSGVQDGTYEVQASSPEMFGVSTVALDSANRERLPTTIVMRPLTTARGRVLFEGDSPVPPVDPQNQPVTFQPTNFTTGPIGGNGISLVIQSDWRFEMPNLAWFGVLRVNPPTGWALAHVRHDGRDITDTPFDFQSGDVSGLEIVLTNRVGTVSGTVVGGGQLAANARVVVFGAADTGWIYLSRTMRNVKTDERGAFAVDGLVPGRYLAVAISGEVGLSDHAGLLNLLSFAVPFTVSQGTNSVVRLTLSR